VIFRLYPSLLKPGEEEVMDDIIFSSWGDRIVDNRGKDTQDYDPVENIALPESFRREEKIKGLMGWNGIILRSADVNIFDFLREYIEAVYDHAKTCDKCNYCKTGWKEQLEVLQDIENGEATEEDLEFMESSAEAIVDAGKCSIGKAGPTPIFHALKYFAENFSRALKGGQPDGAATYYSKLTAPCTDACPIHLDIPKYIELIKDAKFTESLEVIGDRLPLAGVLGRACYHPCEMNCRRSTIDEAISIRLLKRFVADQGLAQDRKPDFPVSPSGHTGKIAVIGAGPAGITCAYHLARKGHQVTIFEKLPLSGGMMAVGIPEYTLPRNIVDTEIQRIREMGVEIRTGVDIGKDITIEQLRTEGYQAIFLSIGAHECKALGIDGEDLEGVYSGVDFLREVRLDNKTDLGNRVVVIGGGNVAIDVARSALRTGAGDVKLVCLEKREEMPAWDYEIEEALEEGITLINGLGPSKFLRTQGKVSGIEFKRCTAVFDEEGRFNPRYDEKDLTTMEAGTVIVAIGQASDISFAEKEAVPVTPQGGLEADPITFQTTIDGVFAGGDALTGPKSLVEATAGGRRAAFNIDRLINGLPVEPDEEDYFDVLFKSIKIYDPNELIKQKIEISQRKRPAVQPPENRVSDFEEVEQGLTMPDAVAEAERCLRCYRVVTVAL
jgi:NADPH-dependent glutamate synthase beta subunit-like oxidoreductase